MRTSELQRGRRGFTLIEVMVVMAILAGLIGGVTIVVGQAQKKKMVFLTQSQRLAPIAACLEQMKDPSKLGVYPPTQAASIMTVKAGNVGKTLGALNDKNAGIESVWVACHLAGVGVKPDGFDEEGAVSNTDDDSAAAMIPNMDRADLYEYCDAWGNPLVYINARDFKSMQKVEQYVLPGGVVIKVQPRASPTGGFTRDSSFQLFSIGPDAIPGTDDDIHWGD